MKRIIALEWKRAQRHQNPLSLLLIDVDNFKQVNDTTEYAFGDEVLRRVADALKQNVRETDFAARFGGDEFCVLLPQTSPAEAVQTALRIRQRIAGMTVQNANFDRQVTVSIGVDSYDGRKASSVDQLRRHANRALHEAKRRGKNQVWLYSGSEQSAPASSSASELEQSDSPPSGSEPSGAIGNSIVVQNPAPSSESITIVRLATTKTSRRTGGKGVSARDCRWVARLLRALEVDVVGDSPQRQPSAGTRLPGRHVRHLLPLWIRQAPLHGHGARAGRDDDRAPAPVLGPQRQRPRLRGRALLLRRAGAAADSL